MMLFCQVSCLKGLCEMKGWRRTWVAFVFGLLAALAFPPFNLVPVLWVSFPALLLLLQGTKRGREAFAVGWSFSFGLFVLSLYWIAGSLFVDIQSFWWALPFALAGLPALLALFYGLAALLAFKWGLRRLDSPFVLALFWFAAEIARAHLFTGFPWDILGYVWGDCLPVLQSVSLIGIEGLTLVTLLLAVLPAFFFCGKEPRRAAFFFGVGLLVLVGLVLWGQLRVNQPVDGVQANMRLRLIQPNVDQEMKWKDDQRFKNLQDLLHLSFVQPSEKPITHFIWPETATAYYLTEETGVRRAIAENMPKDSVLLTGVLRRQPKEDGGWRYYNSLIVMDARANVVAGYDKHHLVPFGEYMPFRSLLSVPTIVGMGSDFMAGEGVRTVRAQNVPRFSALVCYEAIFSGAVVERDDPPQFLLNVTNDAWYKNTIGPAQHFVIARTRAIEEGLPLVRVANQGVTAVVDSYGRIMAKIGDDQVGFVDSDLPLPLVQGTVFSALGNKVAWSLAGILFVFLVIKRNFIIKKLL